VGRGGDQITIFGEEEGCRAAHLHSTRGGIWAQCDGASGRPKEAAVLLCPASRKAMTPWASAGPPRPMGREVDRLALAAKGQLKEERDGPPFQIGTKDRNKNGIKFQICGS
jgi:hypothetical protein